MSSPTQVVAVCDADPVCTACLCSCDASPLPSPLPFSLTDAGRAREPLHRPALALNVSTFEDAYILARPGCDGVVFDAQGRALADTLHFTDFDRSAFDLATLRESAREVDTPLVRVLDASWRNYYHWLILGLGRAMLYERFADEPKAPIVYDWSKRNASWWPIGFGFEVWRDSLARSGVGARRFSMDDGIYRVKSLDVVWLSIDQPPWVTFLPQLYECLREISFAGRGPADAKIFIERRRDPRIDERVIVALDRLRTWNVYRPAVLETIGFEAQLQLFGSANIVVAPHGAGLANLAFAPRGAKVVELNRRIAGESQLRPWFQYIAAGMDQVYCSLDLDESACSSSEIYDRLVELARL